ncbi:MAG: hypothetical protein ABIA63_00135, partial [bacterium]
MRSDSNKYSRIKQLNRVIVSVPMQSPIVPLTRMTDTPRRGSVNHPSLGGISLTRGVLFPLTLICLLLIVPCCSMDQPLVIIDSDQGKIKRSEVPVILIETKPEILHGRIEDFQPHKAEASYSLNFEAPIPIKGIDKYGFFQIKEAKFIEGTNTFTIHTRNALGMENRQTTIFQLFTTPVRVDVVWPYPASYIRESRPRIAADIFAIYEQQTIVDSRDIDLIINGNSVPREKCKVSKIYPSPYGKSHFRFEYQTGKELEAFDAHGKPMEYRIMLTVRGRELGSGNELRPYTNYWSFFLDKTPPEAKIWGSPAISSALNDNYHLKYSVNDNLTKSIRDIRFVLFCQVPNEDRWRPVKGFPDHFIPNLSSGLRDLNVPLRIKEKSLFNLIQFWQPDESKFKPLKSGTYHIVVRARDNALMDSAHALFEFNSAVKKAGGILQRVSESQFRIQEKAYFGDLYYKPDQTAGLSYNWSCDTLTFKVDNEPPVITVPDSPVIPAVYSTAREHDSIPAERRSRLFINYSINEPSRVNYEFYKKGGDYTYLALSECKDIDTEGDKTHFVDFGTYPDILGDGIYDVRLFAADLAGNISNTLVFKDIIIDRTGPVIKDIFIASMVLGGDKINLKDSSDRPGIHSKRSIIEEIKFKCFDRFDDKVQWLPADNVVLKIEQGNRIVSFNGITRRDSQFTVNGLNFDNIFNPDEPKTFGLYHLAVSARDIHGNYNTGYIPVVNVTLSPEITSPAPYDEVAGTFVIRGRAKDPNWTDEFEFSRYIIEYCKLLYEDNNLKQSGESWHMRGIKTPLNVRNRQKEPYNYGYVPVDNHNILAVWDTRAENEILQGYYRIRLSVYDAFYTCQKDLKSNYGHFASCTRDVFIYNNALFDIGSSPEIKAVAESGQLDFSRIDSAEFTFKLNDSRDKLYQITIGLLDENNDYVFTEDYRNIAPAANYCGRPVRFDRPGYFIWSEGGRWIVKWNKGESDTEFSGIIKCHGSIFDGFKCDDDYRFSYQINNSDLENPVMGMEPVSVLKFSSPEGSGINEFSFTAQGKLEFLLGSGNKPCKAYLGPEMTVKENLNFTIQSISAPASYFWKGKNRFNFYPPPGRYTYYVCARAENGLGFAEDSITISVKTPFGVKIDNISKYEFNTCVLDSIDSISCTFRPFSRSRVAVKIIDGSGSFVTELMDTTLEGRSDSALPYYANWAGIKNGNEIVPTGQYRFVAAAGSPADSSVVITDTSKPFRVISELVNRDSKIAELTIKADTTITYGNILYDVVRGRSDFRWMAMGYGSNYPNVPFKFRLRYKGRQLVNTCPFQRFTVKARRRFDRLKFKIGVAVWATRYKPIYFWGQKELPINDAWYFPSRKADEEKLVFECRRDDPNVEFPINLLLYSEIIKGPKRNYKFKKVDSIKVFFLAYDFDSSYKEWGRNSWEDVKITQADIQSAQNGWIKAGVSGLDESKYLWVDLNKNRVREDGEFFAYEDLKRYKGKLADYSNPSPAEISLNSISPANVKRGDFSQFNVLIGSAFIKDNKKTAADKLFSPGNEKFQAVIKIQLKPEVWDRDYEFHGRNNLVNRHTTWDSENSLYYGNDKNCFTNLDNLDNNMDGNSAGVEGFRDYKESQIRFINARNSQRFNFRYLAENTSRDLHFGSLETGKDGKKSLHYPKWDFKLEGVGDAGRISGFKLEQINGKRSIQTSQNKPVDILRNVPDNESSLDLKVSVADVGNSAGTEYIEWPVSRTGVDSINNAADGIFLQSKPRGFSINQKFIKHEDVNFESGLGPFCSGLLKRRHDGSYCLSHHVGNDITSDGNVSIISVVPESIASPIPLKYELIMDAE